MGFRFQRIYRIWLDHEDSWRRILGIALVLRVVLLVLVAREPLVSDSLYYHQAAIALVHDEQVDTYWPPGLPLYEAPIVWLLGEGEIWIRLAMLPWFLWLCRSFYHIAYRLHSRVVANLGLLVLAIYPAMLHQSVEPLSYLPAAALLLAIFGHMQTYVEDKRRRSLWRAGLLLGILVLFRPSAALFVLALPPLILLRRRKFVPGFVLVALSALVVGPWIAIASQQAHHIVPINDANARNLYLGNNAWTPSYKTWYYGSHWTADPKLPAGFREALAGLEALPVQERGRAYTRAALAQVQAHPDAFLVRTAARMRTLLAFDTMAGARLRWSTHPLAGMGYAVLGLEALLFCLLGISSIWGWFSTARRELSSGTVAIISGFLLLYAMPYWISFSHPTYHLPMLPLLLLVAAVAWRQWLELGKIPPWRPRQAWKAWLVMLLFVAIQVEWIIHMLFIPPLQ